MPDTIDTLKRNRPRSRLLRWCLCAFALLFVVSWFTGGFDFGELGSEKRLRNLTRFLGEIRPYPIQQGETGIAPVWNWARELLANGGIEAAVNTLSISVAAIILASVGAWLLLPLSSRNFATPEPFLPGGAPRAGSRWRWRIARGTTRALLILSRSIPEYVIAFLLLALLGTGYWPAVLALAIHNAGILGRLGSEVIENTDRPLPSALRSSGATRLQILSIGTLPIVLPRFLVYFFYRWETCVRDAVVLGLLGITSLGFYVNEAQARFRYDEMVFFVLLGAAIVLLGDVASALVRRWVRSAA